ncbi:hypothetical protein PsorP6_010950 [Peronosclerospora sorghi]|uniref:Uncharacterized protein n=1 Tax=Peronosclerospora sorghi TaxID=230839 RepID=A0ACC0VX82_9STRA|nr:hypothetical protein PsorP6_010950 [Peronosclerospora sorghi]
MIQFRSGNVKRETKAMSLHRASAVNGLSGPRASTSNSNHGSLDTSFNDLLCSRLRLTTSDDICRDSLSSKLGSTDVTWPRINE